VRHPPPVPRIRRTKRQPRHVRSETPGRDPVAVGVRPAGVASCSPSRDAASVSGQRLSRSAISGIRVA
jgi:hypothetical protein